MNETIDWVLQNKFQDKNYWVEIWGRGDEQRIVIGTFYGFVITDEYIGEDNLRLSVNIKLEGNKPS